MTGKKTEKKIVKQKEIVLHIPITENERRKTKVVAALNGWGLKHQVAQYVREGIERDMPGGKVLVQT